MARPENTITIIGRLTGDPESIGSDENKGCRFTVAVDRPAKRDKEGKIMHDQNGYAIKDSDFFRCAAWGPRSENFLKNLAKGRQVAVQGEMRLTSKKNDDGSYENYADIRVDDVRYLDSKAPTGSSEEPTDEVQPEPAAAGTSTSAPTGGVKKDPF